MSAATVAMAAILVFLVSKDIGIQLSLYYAASTALIAATALVLKIHFFSVKEKNHEVVEGSPFEKAEKKTMGWKVVILVFCLVLVAITVPLYMVRFLDPTIWFLLIVCFASGVSLSDILFYYYIKKWAQLETP